jgi:hypothetical protein
MKTKYVCEWALYKDVWHSECHFFLTSTIDAKLFYTHTDIPIDYICPDCEREIVVIERKFGR